MRKLVLGLALIIAAGNGDTLLSESFDSTWTPNSPPAGWRIFHTDTTSQDSDDWHQEPANFSPWDSHPTPFAAIYQSASPDSTPDSLISPVINCTGYQNIILVCSTYFIHTGDTTFRAEIRYSLDGGATFPDSCILKQYQYDSTNLPVQESLYLTYATNQANVVLAWVFEGDLGLMQCWYLDDVEVLGESIPIRTDIACTGITSPPLVMTPGVLTPRVWFQNLGDTTMRSVPVACSLYDSAMNPLFSWSGTLDSLLPGAPAQEFVFADPCTLTLGDYYFKVWHEAVFDDDRSNDTLDRNFTVAPRTDIACTRITAPLPTTRPGSLFPRVWFQNLGDTNQYNVAVACSLYDSTMTPINGWSGTLDSLLAGAPELEEVFTPAYMLALGSYYFKAWHEAPLDDDRSNDTLSLSFIVTPPGNVLFAEDFDAFWSTNSPPAGWRIFHSDPMNQNTDDWHRKNAGFSPWINHPTPFAGIHQSANPDSTPDSLISPVFSCAGYRNIVLVCSTYFWRLTGSNYRAEIRYSTDGGLTFPNEHVLRQYQFGSSSFPVQESLRLRQAAGQPNVALAWIFEGDLGQIQCWYLDDIEVIGEPAPEYDIACTRIVEPMPMMFPGDLMPRVRFRNRGDSSQFNVPVACSLYDAAMNPLFAWSDTIDTLLAGTAEVERFINPPYPLSLGDYYFKCWHEAALDENRANDTLELNFSVSTLSMLYYDDGNAATYQAWPVGHWGWGVEFTPTTYPVYIESLLVYLAAPANPNHCRYQLAVVRPDSAGRPGAMLLKTPVLDATPSDTGWHSIFMADAGEHLVINSGSFFVFYLQVGEPPECPRLGRDSARSPGVTYWQCRGGVYRPDSTNGDYMIRVWLENTAVTPPNYDLRTLDVEFPEYDFVRRPFNRPMSVAARIQNFGTTDLIGLSLPVSCTIFGVTSGQLYTSTMRLPDLLSGQDTLIVFPPCTLTVSERCSVIVSVYNEAAPDDEPENDDKRFATDVIQAAYTGTSPLNYCWIDSDTTFGPVYSWIDTAGFNIAPNLGDELRINIPTHFHFPFYDSVFNYVYVSANGWMSMGTSNPGGTGDSLPKRLPDAPAPNLAIYPYWDNLAMGPGFGSGYLFYKTFGVAPNRYFVLTFQDVNRVGTDTTDKLTFQVIINENGIITFQYKDVTSGDPTFDYGRMASVGLESGTGTDGLCYLYARPPMSTAVNDLANRLEPGRAISLFRIRRDAAALEIVSPEVFDFPGPLTPRVKIQNYGTVTDSIRVFVRIGSEYFWNTTVSGLAPGDSAVIACSTWDATVGRYTAVCSTGMVGDVDSSNDVASKYFTISNWAQRPDIPGGWRRRKVKDGALAYAPTTHQVYAMKGANTNEFWRFDPATRTWDTLAPMPTEPSGSRARDGNDLAFDGTYGTDGRIWALKGGGRTDFYYYDIARDSWVPRKAMFVNNRQLGRISRMPKKGAAIAFVPSHSALGEIYAIPGNGSNDFLRYDAAGDTWNFLYDGTGNIIDIPSRGLSRTKCKFGSDLRYDPDHDKLYVVKGSNTLELYGYDLALGAWTDTLDDVSLLGPTMRKVKSGASLAYYNNRLFLFKGGNTQEYWRYEIAYDSWTRMTDIPRALVGRRVKVKRGSAQAVADSTIFCLKGSFGFEFWEYLPAGDSYRPPMMLADAGREGVMARPERLSLSRPFLSAYPNPTRSGLVLEYNLTSPAQVRLRVYDAAGRTVRHLVDAPRLNGLHRMRWDGRDSRGQVLAAGIYFVELKSGDIRLTEKLIIQR